MKTIIIKGQRELAQLPELWYTDGTDEANEWADTAKMLNGIACQSIPYIGWNNERIVWHLTRLPLKAYTYITPSEFLRLVYQPWKESKKVKLPKDYSQLSDFMVVNSSWLMTGGFGKAKHINACIQLTNIMNFTNDAFEADNYRWTIKSGAPSCLGGNDHPIYFTSEAAADWAYYTFPEIFKAYWNV